MEGAQTGGGGGSPAPFLMKTYDMVDDSSTDDIVSWSSTRASFVVWNPPEFSRVLLPSYFKHNNFSSFIRQLNTYGFRKIDPERWEFANEEFIKDQKHLLKNIHRRKPIHSHSHPPGSLTDAERSALEEEIERLSREKTALQASLWKFKHQQSGTKLQLEDLERRLQDMEQRQVKMMSFLARAVNNPTFVEHLVQMAGVASIDFSVIHKKRRLPEGDAGQEVLENSFTDNHSSTSNKPDFGHLFNHDFSSKLKLELSPTVSDGNLISLSTQSSIEEYDDSPQIRLSEGVHQRIEGLPSVPETHELSDTRAYFCSRENVPYPWQSRDAEEADGHISCHLNLTLASSPLQLDKGHSSGRSVGLTGQELDNTNEIVSDAVGTEDNLSKAVGLKQKSAVFKPTVSSLQEATPNSKQMPRVNDVFWERFLTERPGSSDVEEASSRLSTNLLDEKQEDKKSDNDKSKRDRDNMEQLTL